ncbi:MAG: SRPBCC domain-containing protein [bacterium]
MLEKLQITRAEGTELEFQRRFEAPRELVWAAFSDAAHLARWWGPAGCTADPCTVDFRPGGVWHYCLRFGEGQEAWGRAVYQEIDPIERFVYVETRSDSAATAIPPRMVVEMNFSDEAGATLLHSRGTFDTPEDLQTMLSMGVVEGTEGTFARLDELLESWKVRASNGSSGRPRRDTEAPVQRWQRWRPTPLAQSRTPFADWGRR